jgi:pimeloyl-ACP methyl ester carboxylesterase
MTEFVEFRAADATLRGELTRAGADWIVLVHELGRDLDGWKPVVPDLARLPLTVLAFDLRGHGGSDGSPRTDTVDADVEAALELARADGARSVLVAAGGDSVAPALAAAERASAAGFVALGPTAAPTAASRLPRLIVVGSRDEEQNAAVTSLRAGGGWAVAVNVPTPERGLDLLAGDWSTSVRNHMLVFVKDLLASHSQFAAGRR